MIRVDLAEEPAWSSHEQLRVLEASVSDKCLPFEFEVLEAVHPSPEQTAAMVRADLDVLEALWRERLDSALLY